MTEEVNDNLSKALEIPYEEEVQQPVVVPQQSVVPAVVASEQEQLSQEIESDFDLSRRNYRDLLEKGNEALEGILRVADESQHPRAYEVAATMLKNLADMTDKLATMHKQRKDLTGRKVAPQVNVDKAVFVGSTAELLKQVKSQQQS